MADTAQLSEVIAALLRLDPGDVGPETSVARFNSSLERAKLRIGLQRIGMELPTGKLGPTLGSLEAQLGLAQSNGRVKEPQVNSQMQAGLGAPTSAGGLRVGIDIEALEALPPTTDPWEDPFYSATFTPAEIAYALLQPDPKAHFAAAWCAKEALKKSGADWLLQPAQAIELGHRDDGSPLLRARIAGSWHDLSCAVSISHAETMAIAVVGWANPQPTQPSVSTPAAEAAPGIATAPPGGSNGSIVPVVISLLAMALSAYAIFRLR